MAETQLFDLVVIGAGPAGSTCAYQVKKQHPELSVLVIDQAAFPRYKPCGGGISPEVRHYLDFDIEEALNLHCTRVALLADGKRVESDGFDILMARRERFDQYLLDQAARIGVVSRLGCRVLDIEKAESGQPLRVQTAAGLITARAVALAEGGKGRLAHQLGIAPRTRVMPAMEYEHQTDGVNTSGVLEIDFEQSTTGYAWNFPKADGLSLGIGRFDGIEDGGSGLPGRLRRYMRHFGVTELLKPALHGHPILAYAGRQQLVHGRILLIGEIAGCVDPLTAEGIRPAIKSGYLAAPAIVDALRHDDMTRLTKYDRMFHREIGRDYRYARIAAFAVYRLARSSHRLLANRRAVDAFMSVFSGKSTYREQVRPRRLARVLWATLRGRRQTS